MFLGSIDSAAVQIMTGIWSLHGHSLASAWPQSGFRPLPLRFGAYELSP